MRNMHFIRKTLSGLTLIGLILTGVSVAQADELPPCATEDANGCHWDAATQGNGLGTSFTADAEGNVTPNPGQDVPVEDRWWEDKDSNLPSAQEMSELFMEESVVHADADDSDRAAAERAAAEAGKASGTSHETRHEPRHTGKTLGKASGKESGKVTRTNGTTRPSLPHTGN